MSDNIDNGSKPHLGADVKEFKKTLDSIFLWHGLDPVNQVQRNSKISNTDKTQLMDLLDDLFFITTSIVAKRLELEESKTICEFSAVLTAIESASAPMHDWIVNGDFNAEVAKKFHDDVQNLKTLAGPYLIEYMWKSRTQYREMMQKNLDTCIHK